MRGLSVEVGCDGDGAVDRFYIYVEAVQFNQRVISLQIFSPQVFGRGFDFDGGVFARHEGDVVVRIKDGQDAVATLFLMKLKMRE